MTHINEPRVKSVLNRYVDLHWTLHGKNFDAKDIMKDVCVIMNDKWDTPVVRRLLAELMSAKLTVEDTSTNLKKYEPSYPITL